MIYDRHPELQSKWNKAFWARGYYVETIGNITDEAVQKYIKEQADDIWIYTIYEEIASLVHLTAGAIYARMQHLRKKLKDFKQ